MEAMAMGVRACIGMILLGGALGTAGCSVVVSNELDDKPPGVDEDGGVIDEFCRGRDDGTDCSTSDRPDHICVDRQCVERRCGDGYVDEDRGEECDRGDGNNNPGSGCEPDCTFTCVDNEDCDDGNECSGEFICTETNRCVPDGQILPSTCTMPGSESDGGLGDPGFCCDGMCQVDLCG